MNSKKTNTTEDPRQREHRTTSIARVVRSGYYIAKMLPHFIWLPVQMRTRLRHATEIFEDQLHQSGIDGELARELARTYHRANKELIGQLSFSKAWARTASAQEAPKAF